MVNCEKRNRKEGAIKWEEKPMGGGDGWSGVWVDGVSGNGTYLEFRPIIVILLLIPLWQDSSDFGF